MQTALLPFISAYMARGFFTSDELKKLADLFLNHAQDQYFLGHAYADKASDKNTPVSQADLLSTHMLAQDAQRDFITSLAKQRANAHGVTDKTALTAGTIAGLAAATLGIRALNQGTIAHAEKVEFVTRRDFKVCPICEPYDGKIYDVNQQGKAEGGPEIPLHPNCRCRYLVV